MTRNRICYSISLIFASIIVFVLGERHAYPLFSALVLIPVISALSLMAAPRLILIDERANKTDVYKNEALRLSIGITVKGGIPYPALSFSFCGEGFADYELISPGEYSISFPFRGGYTIGIDRFYVTDVCGLIRIGFSRKNPIKVMVLPEVIKGFILDSTNEPSSVSAHPTTLLNDGGADTPDVRKYAPADDYKKIHWKLTAKKNELIVKDYFSMSQTRTYILLDTHETPLKGTDKLKFEDALASYALSAAHYCVNKGGLAALCLADGTHDISNSQDLELISRVLAEVNFTKERMLLYILKKFTQEDGLSNQVIFLTDIDYELFGVISELKRLGRSTVVYHVGSSLAQLDETAQNSISALNAQGVAVRTLAVPL